MQSDGEIAEAAWFIQLPHKVKQLASIKENQTPCQYYKKKQNKNLPLHSSQTKRLLSERKNWKNIGKNMQKNCSKTMM